MASINDVLPPPKRAQKVESVAVSTANALRKKPPATQAVALASPQALARPPPDEIDKTRERTQAALDAILEKKLGKPSTAGPSLVKYTPAGGEERTLRIVDVQYDPLEPARHRHVKAPARPPSPPAPVLKAAAPKMTAEEQRAWYVPPSVSGWKNNKGFVIDVEKRVAADGRHQVAEPQAGNRMEEFASALYSAEASARQEVAERAAAAQAETEREQQAKEMRLKLLAQRARKRPRDEDEDERRRSRAARLKAATRERDVSETVALGGRPAASADAQFDSRLFGRAERPQGLFDEPLFAAQQAARQIYRPAADADSGPVEFERIEDKYE